MKGLSFRAPIARDSVKPLNIYPQKVESSKSSGGNTSLVSRAYYFLTEPNSSRGALRWAVFMLCCVVFNVVILVLESIDGKNNYEGRKDMSTYPNMPAENTYRVIQLILWIPMSIDAVIRIIMTSSVCISEPDLMEEYLEDKFKFALFIFDVLSIIPFVLRYSYLYPRDKDLTAVSRLILKVLDVLSSAKVLRVSKDILSIRAIRIALGRSMRHLVLPFFFFLVFNVFFGVAVYFMEPCYNYESCAWENLFDASFFSVVTMTTTGYGNQVPSYLPSRVVSVIIMLFGSLFMSMPLAIIGNEYANAWENMVLESESSAVTPTASDETSSQRRSGMSIVHQTLTAQSSGTFSQAVTAPMKDSRVGLGKALEKLQELTMQEDSGMSPALVIAFCEVRGWLTPLLSNIRIAICALTDAKVKSDLRRISFMRKSSLTSVPPRKSSIASVPSNVSSVSSLDRGSEIHSQLSDGVRERFKTLRQLDSLVEEDESDIAREQSPREDSKSESVENPRSSNIFGSVLRIAPAYVNRFLTSDTTRSGAVAPADSVKDDADIIPTTQVSAEGLTTVETFEPPEEDNPEECSDEKPDITISNLPTNKNKVELERSYTESTPTDLYSSIMNGESSVVNSKSLSVRGPSSVDGSGQYSKRRQASATEVISPRRISGVKDRFKINPSDVSKPANRSPRRIKREESSTFIIKMAKAAPDIAKMRGDGTEFVRNFDRALKNPSAIRTKVWMLLEFPHSSPGAKALQIFLIILILISVLMLYTQTLPSMYDYGEGTNMCGWVLKAYCTDKHDSSLDPGCFVQDNDGPTSKKLRYFCNDNDCFAHGINYGARYTNMTCANSENLPFQTSDELVYNFRNPEFFVSRKRMHQLHGICTRIECRHDHSQIADGNRGWVPVEIFVNFFFTVEIFLRILVSSSLYGFARDFMNIFDILSVVPFYTDIIRAFRGSGFALDFSILASSPRPMLLVAMKSMSVFRLFKMTRHFSASQVLVTTANRAGRQLGGILSLLFFIVIVFALLLYEVEKGIFCYVGDSGCKVPDEISDTVKTGQQIAVDKNGDPSMFSSVIDALWFSIVTLTSVGYGDIVPVTNIGQAMSIFLMLFGAMYLSMPLTVAASTFWEVHQSYLDKQRAGPKSLLSKDDIDGQLLERIVSFEALLVSILNQIEDCLHCIGRPNKFDEDSARAVNDRSFEKCMEIENSLSRILVQYDPDLGKLGTEYCRYVSVTHDSAGVSGI